MRGAINRHAYALGAAAGLCIGAAATQASGFGLADFEWQIVDTAMGSAEVTDEAIHITGGDAGIPGITEVNTVAFADFDIFFDWSWSSDDEGGAFDFGYYIVNGEQTIIEPTLFSEPSSGSDMFSVSAGDTFGFGVETVDGVFGEGILDISNFKAVPASGTLAPFVIAGALAMNRRRTGTNPNR